MMQDATDIIREQGVMETDRSNFETQWQNVAEHVLPRQADFQVGGYTRTQGMRRSTRIYDETAMLALDHGCAVFESYTMPRGARWQSLAPRDDALLNNRRVRQWYELKTSELFALRSSAECGFAEQSHESVASLLAFGNQAITPELLRDKQGRFKGLYYRSEHIGQLYVRENAWGRVDTIHRKFTLTVRQADQKWGEQAPECVKKAKRDNKLEEKQEFLHVIRPRADHDPDRWDARGKPIQSLYIAMRDKVIFDEGGYRSMPTIYSRFEKSPTETYGRGPVMNVMPAILSTQEMVKDLVTMCELAAKPPLLATDDMLDQVIRYFAGGVTYGGLDYDKNPMLKPLLDGADLAPAMAILDQARAVIKRALWEDLFQVRQEQKTHVSATDILERASEKGVLLSPLSRQETEWFDPMAAREIDLMWEMGLLDDMPPEVREAGGLFQLTYDNPLRRAQMADQAAGFYRTLEGVTPLMQLKPELADQFLAQYPFEKVLAGLGRINAVPAAWESDDDERRQSKEAMAQAGQAQQLLLAAPVVSKVASDLARMNGGAGVAA
ncbi:MAG: portal protein [Pseudomonadota bacterium]